MEQSHRHSHGSIRHPLDGSQVDHDDLFYISISQRTLHTMSMVSIPI